VTALAVFHSAQTGSGAHLCSSLMDIGSYVHGIK